MNVSDSERIAGFLESHKLEPSDSIEQAALVIFNTCGVRQSAEDRVYGQIHNIRKKNPKIKIILTGCLANRKDVQRKLKNKVDLFCEIKDFPIRSVGADLVSARKNVVPSLPDNYLCIPPKYTNNHTAYVPIMTGCNNFCSYCIVPYARGREVSRPAEEILKEIRSLIKKGYKEIILLGQNVNSYSHSLSLSERGSREAGGEGSMRQEMNFPELLRLIEKIPGHFWISFVSSHPKDFSDELIEAIARSKKICEYIHLPIQSGDNRILAKMNRKYTAEHYLKLVAKVKSTFKKYKPDTLYSITSDIIVGFPGETKKQFLESAKIMKEVKYDMVYFGQFSSRPGTTAAKMKDNISKKEKQRRENYLNEILKKTTYANNKKYVGKTIEVLIDKKDKEIYFGRTRTMKNIKVINPMKNLVGKLIDVEITKANAWNLEGMIIN
jgi:tRNA-2-methylthio-N6-dimethylallyladenosine synthase